MTYDWPLMSNNISRKDIKFLINFLEDDPRLTQADNVSAFEKEWSQWLGVKYSVFVNSGSSANFLTMAALKHWGVVDGEIIVPTLTWVSDIVSVLQNGFDPVFVDINPKTLCMDNEQVLSKINDRTRGVFLTHVQGFNGLTDRLLNQLKVKNIPLIEDVCESHGATFKGKKLGTFGLISNFSFYYAHHLSTIEGGMVCTDDESLYNIIRMLRSHGMVREAVDETLRKKFVEEYADLSPDFIFAYPGYNMRNTELGAVIGRNQLKRLAENNLRRRNNFAFFLNSLDPDKYRTDFDLNGNSNYAFNLILSHPDVELRSRVEATLREAAVEYRRGSSGGGNQLRQPYLRNLIAKGEWRNYPEVEHIHFFGYYIGNYPALESKKIIRLCHLLNNL